MRVVRRLAGRAAIAAVLLAGSVISTAAAPDPDAFPAFVESLRPDSRARGVSDRTFEAAFAGVSTPDGDAIARITTQSEFTRPVWNYLVDATSAARIGRGRALAERLSAVLRTIEARTGVPRWIILAFWGIESDFGTSPGTVPTGRALASLAFARHRAADFREETLAALQILERGDIAPDRMKGSWAGAMGQVQFLPSVYLKYAADYDGDGHPDIWNSQSDSLASIGNYLQKIGWNSAVSWGYEVSLPQGFDLSRYRGDLGDFAKRGVRRTDGRPLPGGGNASLFLPGGSGGPVFLITDNFEVIRIYNTSDSYALAVGHLADRLSGAPTLAAPWPTSAPRLDRAGLLSLQQGLAQRGLYAGDMDGRAGPKLRESVRQYQIREGLTADGYAHPALLDHMSAHP